MECPKCGQSTHQHKIGKTKAGSQRLWCYICGCSYTPEKKVQGYSKTIRDKAIKCILMDPVLVEQDGNWEFIIKPYPIGRKR